MIRGHFFPEGVSLLFLDGSRHHYTIYVLFRELGRYETVLRLEIDRRATNFSWAVSNQDIVRLRYAVNAVSLSGSGIIIITKK